CAEVAVAGELVGTGSGLREFGELGAELLIAVAFIVGRWSGLGGGWRWGEALERGLKGLPGRGEQRVASAGEHRGRKERTAGEEQGGAAEGGEEEGFKVFRVKHGSRGSAW